VRHWQLEPWHFLCMQWRVIIRSTCVLFSLRLADFTTKKGSVILFIRRFLYSQILYGHHTITFYTVVLFTLIFNFSCGSFFIRATFYTDHFLYGSIFSIVIYTFFFIKSFFIGFGRYTDKPGQDKPWTLDKTNITLLTFR
jgi:hypothetical protein